MKILIAYLSESGNTEKLAKAIFEGIESSEKEIVSIKDVSGTEGYDIIFIGFPVQSHSMPIKVEAFAKNLPDGQKVAYFATHGSMRGGEMAVTAFHHAITVSNNAEILGSYGCRGQVKQSIIDSLLQKPEHRGWALEAQGAAGHPDAADLEDGKDWARKMITKARAR